MFGKKLEPTPEERIKELERELNQRKWQYERELMFMGEQRGKMLQGLVFENIALHILLEAKSKNGDSESKNGSGGVDDGEDG